MNRIHKTIGQRGIEGRRRQRGVMTTFSAVLILVLLTLMMFFAMRVGGFEQRVSSADALQKLAFHTAEAGIHHAKEYLLAHSLFLARSEANVTPDGRDGWLAPGLQRWKPCSDAGLNLSSGEGSHPCFGEPNPDLRADLYYYDFNDSRELPINTNDLITGTDQTVAVEALLCVFLVDFDSDTPVQGCSTDTGLVDGRHYMVTLLARAGAECNGGNCAARALVREQVSNFGGAAGGNAPSVPLTTRTTFPPTGSAEIVPNPNSGGIGVPVSVWMNANESCPAGQVVDASNGSWATCEAHEWYGSDSVPNGVACPGNCSCSRDESISYTHGNEDVLGIDLVSDSNFPCDLFRFFFGVPSDSYEIVKGYSQVISSCDTLDENSAGIYWVSGPECRINSNTVVGSPEAPVLLISAASLTRMNGGAEIFGILFLTDTEDATATLDVNGNNQVYGSVVVDSVLDDYNGTFQIIYNEHIVGLAAGGGGLGSVIGGWSDFHPDWD